jgi:hypothetical protein
VKTLGLQGPALGWEVHALWRLLIGLGCSFVEVLSGYSNGVKPLRPSSFGRNSRWTPPEKE